MQSKIAKLANLVYKDLNDFSSTQPAVEDLEPFIIFERNNKTSSNGEVRLVEDSDELCIQIAFNESFSQKYLALDCPSVSLSKENLALLALVAEEVSHFHEITQSAISHQQLSKLDLELQAEFDKVEIASLWMKKQHGHSNITALIRLLFDHSHIKSKDSVYSFAESISAKWWWSNISTSARDVTESPRFNEIVREIRKRKGYSKIDYIRSTQAFNLGKKAA